WKSSSSLLLSRSMDQSAVTQKTGHSQDLVRATWRRDRPDAKLQQAIDASIQQRQSLGAVFDAITQPPVRDYEAEARKRQQQHETERQARFRKHRSRFENDLLQIASGQNLGPLISLANGYLDRYGDLASDTDPKTRLIEWVGEEVAEAAIQGFLATLQRDDLPDLDKIYSIRTEGKHWTIEPVILAGISEVVRSGRSLNNIPQSVVQAALGIWWDMPEFNSTKLGNEIETSLEDAVFADDHNAEIFVTAIIEPQLEASKQHATGLYRFVREPKFLPFSPRLALKWLRNFPTSSYDNQLELIQLLLAHSDKFELNELIAERVGALDALEEGCKRLWIAAAFCFAPSALAGIFQDTNPISKEMIWTIKAIIMPDRTERKPVALPVDRYAAIVEAFAHDWPMTGHPSSGWSGEQNPWDASEFISYCINAIGADGTAAGTEAFEQLSQKIDSTGYFNSLKHVAHEQKRNRRDEEYVTPTFNTVKNILANSTPLTVSDLKLLLIDHITDIHKYLRDADTNGWESFWNDDIPKNENTCRDRLLDLLRPRLPSGIELFPELPMPDANRVDIYASILGQGLPIEIKGQWHSQVWNASKTQLDEKYCRDWRTDGHGIYLVLWFGNVAGKNLPTKPDSSSLPSTPLELRDQLVQRLGEHERTRIDVVVLNLSKPVSKTKTGVAKKPRRKRTLKP
ncbi:hypothetical protein, partial [Hoeflea sp.]|uniref:hypothetical protein n=1 Tax=Hoeflea sp. TaxID=1940281 RepID=UPI003A958BC1